MEIKPLESGPGLRSNRAGGRLDLFHHARSEARYSLPSVPTLLRGRPELLPVRATLISALPRIRQQLWPPSDEQRWDARKTVAGFRSCMMTEIEPCPRSIRP